MRIVSLTNGLIIVALLLAIPSFGAVQTSQNPVVLWESAALQGARSLDLGAPVTARALAIVSTCMYEAWAAYDPVAVGTHRAPRSRTQTHGALSEIRRAA
jgi:hypothetical protein